MRLDVLEEFVAAGAGADYHQQAELLHPRNGHGMHVIHTGEARRPRDAAYRAAHRDELLSKARDYYAANREAVKARQRAYREANRDRERARQRGRVRKSVRAPSA